ncbi:AAA family ATPase [Pseudarthrobacter phenanthrenivorans]|uniref:AAA family ATPase n=1 Tax=Pseudarthrobacter phenanthrenivorans TaxID=361575 RepID=UPI002F35BD22
MRVPQLHSLRVENFRSLAGTWEVPLDADVVLVHGANGAGKTSLLSALELGATGNVRFLSKGAHLDQSLIINRSYPLGAVELRVADPGGSLRIGSFEFDRNSLRGAPALDDNERSYFSERSFLAQTQLGRFIETYTASSKQGDSALVRFVKSLVGLEELDWLIEGLRSAGHVNRTRNATEGWGMAERLFAIDTAERDNLRTQLAEIQQKLAVAESQLRELLDLRTPGDILELAAHALRVEALDETADELSALESARVRLAGVIDSRLANSEKFDDGSHTVDALASQALNDYSAWENGTARRVLTVVNEIRLELFALPAVTVARIFESFDDVRDRVVEARSQQQVSETARAKRKNRRGVLQKRISEISRQLQAAADRSASFDVPSDVRIAIDALTAVLPLALHDSCPVCDQAFAGGATALSAHISAKVAQLSSAATALFVAEGQERELRNELAGLELALADSEEPESGSETDYALQLRRLNDLEETVESGRALLRLVQSSQAKLADVAALRASEQAAARAMASICEQLGEKVVGSSINEQIQHLTFVLDERVQAAHFRNTRRARSHALAQQVIDENQRLREVERRIGDIDQEISKTETKLKEASARKVAANELKKKAERLRSDVISRVFDERLNGLWGDLFKRFAPSEPFIPRFRKEESSSRYVDVRLETALDSGEVGGAPGEMLSFGNSNTAAISLFTALHLSAPTKVPWLIFDDPVQSMDDIHIANFATVVRELAYRHNRQIVVAVHQRELFDYLSLELAPAMKHQSLITVEVDRTGGATRLEWNRVGHKAEPPLQAAQ